MSGNVTAWVLKHYPCASPKDRTRKAVLVTVAEAANKDFTNAYPSIGKLCAQWHLSRSTADTALKELLADGWLEITDQGGGRGRSTVYRICVERAEIPRETEEQDRAVSKPNRAIRAPKPRDPEPETARNGTSTRITQTRDTPVENTLPATPDAETLPGMPKRKPSKVQTDPLVAEAHALTTRVFNNRRPRPLPKFLDVRGLAERALRSEVTASDIEAAMMLTDCVFTLHGLTVSLGRLRNTSSTGGGYDKFAEIDRRFPQEAR